MRLSVAQLDCACWRDPSNFNRFQFGLRQRWSAYKSFNRRERGRGGGTHWSGKRKGEDGNLKETDVVRAQSFKVAHAGREPATRDAPGRDDCFGGGVVSGRI